MQAVTRGSISGLSDEESKKAAELLSIGDVDANCGKLGGRWRCIYL